MWFYKKGKDFLDLFQVDPSKGKNTKKFLVHLMVQF